MRYSLLLHLFFIFTYVKSNKSMDIWKDKLSEFQDYDDSVNFENDKCLEKKNAAIPSVTTSLRDKNPRFAQYYHTLPSQRCSCGIEYRLMDLGNSYYPRYLHTGVCKPEACGGLYRCVEKHYKVRVLKERDEQSTENKLAIGLPENLKNSWQPEIVTVTVSCECSL